MSTEQGASFTTSRRGAAHQQPFHRAVSATADDRQVDFLPRDRGQYLFGRMSLGDDRLGRAKQVRHFCLELLEVADGRVELLVVLLLPGRGHRLDVGVALDRLEPIGQLMHEHRRHDRDDPAARESGQESFPASAAIRSPNSEPSNAATSPECAVRSAGDLFARLAAGRFHHQDGHSCRVDDRPAHAAQQESLEQSRAAEPDGNQFGAPFVGGREQAGGGGAGEFQPFDVRLPLFGKSHLGLVENGVAERPWARDAMPGSS